MISAPGEKERLIAFLLQYVNGRSEQVCFMF